MTPTEIYKNVFVGVFLDRTFVGDLSVRELEKNQLPR